MDIAAPSRAPVHPAPGRLEEFIARPSRHRDRSTILHTVMNLAAWKRR
jgi:hypothetical protein